MCEAFNCPPDVAERQDAMKVNAILEYRLARTAIELFNQGANGVEALQKHPAMVNLLVELHRAQGSEATEEAIIADMQARGNDDG